jgi:hypothetical protein
VIDALPEADLPKQRPRPRRAAAPRELGDQLNVLKRGERRDQVEELKHEAQALPAKRGPALLIKSAQITAGNPERPAARRLDRADHVEQRRLPRPARTEHHHQLSRADLEIDAIERADRQLTLAVHLAHPAQRHGRHDRCRRVLLLKHPRFALPMTPPAPPTGRPTG